MPWRLSRSRRVRNSNAQDEMNRLTEFLKSQGQSGIHGSIANRLRRKRFDIIRGMIESIDKDAPILDIGGTDRYWEVMGLTNSSHQIILFNTEVVAPRFLNMVSVLGDGKDLSRYRDGEFQFVHSNSTLQYLRTVEDQFAMAREIRRVGRSYYVQAPNFWFPLETHFLFPAFKWLPEEIQIWLAMNYSLGWYDRQECAERARATVRGIRLTTRREFAKMFDDAHIATERFLGWPKSFVARKDLR